MNRTCTNLLSLAALIIILAAARLAQEIVLPFLLAAFVAIIAAAPVAWLRNKGTPAWLAVSLIVILMLGILLLALLILAGSIDSFSQALPSYTERLRSSTQQIVQWFAQIGIALPEQGILGAMDPGAVMRLVNAFLGGLSGLMSNTFLILMAVIFLLLEASVFSSKIELIRNDEGRTLANITGFLAETRHYMAIKTVISLVTGVLIGIGMTLLGLAYPVLWGFLAFLLNFIPTLGSILAAIPAVLMAFVQLGIASALSVAVYFIVINMLIGNVVEPRVLGRGVGLSPLVVFLSMIFWGWLLGPVGMLLSVPLTMLIKFWAESREDTTWFAIMLSSPDRLKTANQD